MTHSVIWIALVVASIGTWMCNAGSGWLMTNPMPIQLIIYKRAYPAWGRR